MKTSLFPIAIASSLLVAPHLFAADSQGAAPVSASRFDLPDKNSPEVAWWRDSQTKLNDRLAWFREARFGMFIHWGVYSTLGNEFKGRVGGTYGEHIQRVLKIPIPEYRKDVAGIFNPTEFNADAWVALAALAGMKYLIITSKHHDGFAMWPTKVNDYNIIDATPWKQDPMKPLKAACQKHGIKFGFYYSQAFDWGNELAPGNDWDYQNPGGDTQIGGKEWWKAKPEFMTSARKYVDTKAIPQLRELITNYKPDILWFDTASKLPPAENLRILKAVREMDPNVVISGRLVHGWGDYDDTADRPANFPPHDGDWEAIPTTNESYGWSKFDHSHKPAGHFVQLLAKAAARGGNVLMNIGPMGTGKVDPVDAAILKEIGEWSKVNGESIHGTTRTPLPVQAWGESTRKGSLLYLHVFRWPRDGKLVVGGLTSEVTSAELLTSGNTLRPKLRVSRLNGSDLAVSVPAQAPNRDDSVVVLRCAGEIQAATRRLLQPRFSEETLHVFDGTLQGTGLKYGAGKKTNDFVMNWTSTEQSITWPVRLTSAANYEITTNYTAAKESAGGSFAVSFGPQKLEGSVKAGTDQNVTLGRVSLQPGEYEIKVTATKIAGAELMNLRSLELKAIGGKMPLVLLGSRSFHRFRRSDIWGLTHTHPGS